MKAVLQYRASPGLQRRIAALDVDTVVVDETDTDAFLRAVHDAEVLLHVLEPVTAAVIDAAPRLRLIQKIGIGVNTIDLDAARRRGIAVCDMPGTNTQAVAEMTLLLMLATLRRVAQLDGLTRAGRGWSIEPGMADDLGELAGRTVGLVGFGGGRAALGADIAGDRCHGNLHQPARRHGLADPLRAVLRNAAARRRALTASASGDGDGTDHWFGCPRRDEARQHSDQHSAGTSRR